MTYENWHERCKVPDIGAEWFGTEYKGTNTMFTRFDSASRALFSVVGALCFAAIAVSAAVPILPIA